MRTIENPLHFTDSKCKELKNQLKGPPGSSTSETRSRASSRSSSCRPRTSCAGSTSSSSSASTAATTRQQPRAWQGSGTASSTGLRRVKVTASRRPSPSSSRSSCRRSASPASTGSARSAPTSWRAKSFDAGPTWEDYLATNPALPNDYERRVRVYLSERTATDEDRKSVQRAAHREYLALQGISHDGIVRAEQYSEELRPGPAVVFQHGKAWQRLDHFMAATTTSDLPIDTRLEMIRQLAEALDHAHRRHLYHRALAPRSV